MSRSFTKQEKENIKKSLTKACIQSWTQYGYKKTGIDELCKQVGISKGAFYLFFESKEALFCEVLCSVQAGICDAACEVMEQRQNKYGAAEALKLIYRAYEENRFLYDSDSADYMVLRNKLSQKQAQKMEASSEMGRRLFLDRPYLLWKVDADLAMSVIYALLMNVKNKEILPYSHRETFDFMIDHLIDSLLE